jgi:hypothetical protein
VGKPGPSWEDNIVTCMSAYRRGYGLDIGFIDLINTQLLITPNYNAIADFHTLKITLSLSQPAVSSLDVSW